MVYRATVAAPVYSLRREIDRLFEDTFGREGTRTGGWVPSVDVREDDEGLMLAFELPGVDPSAAEITVDNGVLTVRGTKQESRQEGDENSRYHVIERMYGEFVRSFALPKGVDESKIEASFDRGVLTIRVPKAALPQPKRVQIKAGESTGDGSVVKGQQQTGQQQGKRQEQGKQQGQAQGQQPAGAGSNR